MKPELARVVLTGATGGIGQATAAVLLEAGATVLMVGRSAARLAALERQLLQARPECRHRLAWQVADVCSDAGVAAVRAAADASQANVLINNAGVPSFGRFDALGAEHLAEVLNTNLLAPMRLTQALLPGLQQRGAAQVIQVGSVLGRLALPGHAAYCASKFGLRGFTEALRRELRGSGVVLQYLGPRSTRTAFNDKRVDAYHQATRTQVDTPQVVARAVLDLLRSERAEMFLGFPERLAVKLNGLAPTWMDAVFEPHRRHLATPDAPGAPGAPDTPTALPTRSTS